MDKTAPLNSLGLTSATRVLPFFLAIFSSWLLWIPAGARAAGVLPFAWPFELAWLGVFSPFIFGLYFTYRAAGKSGLRRFLARIIEWRFPAIYWFVVLLAFPVAALSAAVLVQMITGEGWIGQGLDRLTSGEAASMLMSAKYNALNYESIGPFDYLFGAMENSLGVFILGFVILAFIDGGLSEEPGWRGFAYPVLQDRWGSLWAALVVGLVWMIWHLGPGQWQIPFEQGTVAFFAFLGSYVLAYCVAILPLTIIFAWIFERTGGSILACCLIHMTYNIAIAGAVVLFPEQPVQIGVIGAAWLMALGIVFVCGRHSFGKSPSLSVSEINTGAVSRS